MFCLCYAYALVRTSLYLFQQLFNVYHIFLSSYIFHLATGSLNDVFGSKDEYTSSYHIESSPYSHSLRDVGHHSTASSSYSTSSHSHTTSPYAVSASRTDTKLFTKPFAPKSSTDIHVGMRVLVTRSRGEIGRGVVKYVGPIPGRKDTYIGVELGPGNGEHIFYTPALFE